ncbi:hypothetical protein H4Q26_002850 [Puccinia striiformis f. sp. tritici PST-130]|nr:hypothetical protein H4Q26_002850 [Puccinia striiformis f. sp. tritici PST-130]
MPLHPRDVMTSSLLEMATHSKQHSLPPHKALKPRRPRSTTLTRPEAGSHLVTPEVKSQEVRSPEAARRPINNTVPPVNIPSIREKSRFAVLKSARINIASSTVLCHQLAAQLPASRF